MTERRFWTIITRNSNRAQWDCNIRVRRLSSATSKSSSSSRVLDRLFRFPIGLWYEHSSKELAELGCFPRLWNYVIESVFTESGHDRSIGVTARNDQFRGGVQLFQPGGGFYAAHPSAYRQIQQDRIKTTS